MKTPHQSQPVNRSEIREPDLILVSVKDSKGKLQQEYQFVRGSDPNSNDPAQFIEPLDCGCQIFSGVSRSMCWAACGLV
jgi:hypothetical protein